MTCSKNRISLSDGRHLPTFKQLNTGEEGSYAVIFNEYTECSLKSYSAY